MFKHTTLCISFTRSGHFLRDQTIKQVRIQVLESLFEHTPSDKIQKGVQ